MGQTVTKLYSKQIVQIISPIVPFQTNSWDCGVFVCRYAYALFHMRGEFISVKLLVDPESSGVWRNFTQLPEFQFDELSINPMRAKMRELINRLSREYKKVRDAELKEEARVKQEKQRLKKAGKENRKTEEAGQEEVEEPKTSSRKGKKGV